MPKDTFKSAGKRGHLVRPDDLVESFNASRDARLKGSKVSHTQDGSVPGELSKIALESLEQDTMGPSWFQALKSEFDEPYFRKACIQAFLLVEIASYTIYPPLSDVYSWSRFIPLDGVKVIILGQDPYHNAGQAHGLAFSVLPPTKPPGSLKNIYKQLSTDIDGFQAPSTGDLTSLAKLGVLFLNTCLTVRAHKAASHSKKGWEKFTERVICTVLNQNPQPEGIVFMAWGLPAQKTYAKIAIDEKKHLILRSAHPSPLSAHRGFLGNGHFRLANEWLEERYGYGIDWNILNARSGE